MIRAVVRNGTIQPLEPMPAEWSDGREVLVHDAQAASGDSPEAIDHWYQELEALCAHGDLEDDERLREALAQAHEHAKDVVRQQMGRS
jgi:hypothetical protein